MVLIPYDDSGLLALSVTPRSFEFPEACVLGGTKQEGYNAAVRCQSETM